ncbi:hypothetical protein APHNP_1327 [Anaplasma phagocytophilum str. ApNP]|uniref:Uncharacterized protein n=2 Tax=Anaplasma phagocytophilum TaxID=948 RepID=A0A0F3NGV5_ANAPH|nr:hypothetical protein APHMUC_1492 [Anaplasma phagocytophilum str. ApMUC09]KJV67016.1 hypothetical protein APHNP_1327 [Anaplasma phagocytophilum str. ApNP]
MYDTLVSYAGYRASYGGVDNMTRAINILAWLPKRVSSYHRYQAILHIDS